MQPFEQHTPSRDTWDTPSRVRTEEEPSRAEATRGHFDVLAFWGILALIALIPLFFLPSASAPFLFGKHAFALVVVVATFIVWGIARMQSQHIRLPRSPLFWSVWLLPGAALLSYLLSPLGSTFFGSALGPQSTALYLVGALGLCLAALVIERRDELLLVLASFLAPFALLALYHTLVYLLPGPNALTLGVFENKMTGPFGTVNDWGMFVGLIALLSLVTLVSVSLARMPLIITLSALISSTALLTVTNVRVVWWLVAATALGALLLTLYRMQSTGDRHALGLRFSASLGVFALSLLFLFGNQALTASIAERVGVSQFEVRPSWQSTLTVGRASLGEYTLFGAGPGTFARVWALYRPPQIDQTIAWNTDFGSGVSTVATSVVSLGVVGLIAWLVFFASFLVSGVRTLLLAPVADPFAYFLNLAAFVGALYLWVLASVVVVSGVLLLLAYLMTGVYLASLRHRAEVPRDIHFLFTQYPRLGFMSVLGITVGIIGGVVLSATALQQYVAAHTFQSALVFRAEGGSREETIARVADAARYSEDDRFYRLVTTLTLERLQGLIAQSASDPTEEQQVQFRGLLERAILNANRAVELDESNYLNWIALGQVYRSIAPLGIDGAYDSAVRAFNEALARRPDSPTILFALAELEAVEGNTDAAEALLRQALTRRPNYTDAIFALAQLQILSGDIAAAEESVVAATLLNPNNPLVFFQLGILRFSQGDYEGASEALSRAVGLDPVYANARYFLGLSRYYLGDTEAAIGQFERVIATNQEITELTSIVENMRAGLDPFTGEQITLPPEEPQPDITTLNALPIAEPDPEIISEPTTPVAPEDE